MKVFRHKTLSVLVLVLVLAVSLGSFGRTLQGDAREPIRVGVFLDLSGPTASFGQATLNGMKLAAAEINDAGGIDGRKLELIVADDRGRPEEAATAAVAIATSPIKNMVIAMLTIQSAASSDIDKAATQYKLLFAGYILLLLLTAFVSWLVWRSGNRVQDAVRAEANARAEEAKRDAGVANEKAGKANERAEALEHDNLTLRGQVATLEAKAVEATNEAQRIENEGKERVAKVEAESREKIASLNTEAEKARLAIATANAVAAQANEEAAQANLRTENERRERLELESALAPRVINVLLLYDEEIKKELGKYPGVNVETVTIPDFEARRLERQIVDLLGYSGWKIVRREVVWDDKERRIRPGVDIELNSPSASDPLKPAANSLMYFLLGNKVQASSTFAVAPPKLPPNTIRIVVGPKPEWYFDMKDWREQRDRLWQQFPPKQ